nr:hypothetical protein [uncultured Prevotella sp.]
MLMVSCFLAILSLSIGFYTLIINKHKSPSAVVKDVGIACAGYCKYLIFYLDFVFQDGVRIASARADFIAALGDFTIRIKVVNQLLFRKIDAIVGKSTVGRSLFYINKERSQVLFGTGNLPFMGGKLAFIVNLLLIFRIFVARTGGK